MKRIEVFCKEKKILYKKDETLANYTTVRIGGKVEFIVFPSEETVKDLVEIIKNEALSYYVIGRGSNLLISDDGYKGVVVNTKKMDKIILDKHTLEVSAGVMLGRLLISATKRNLSGIEGLIGIPGTVGGAIKGNAGSFGYEIKDCLEEIEVLTDDLNLKTLKKQEINFGYRSSGLPETWIIKKAKFILKNDDGLSFERMRYFLNIKRNTQPLRERSAGCVFKNPKEYSAGYLIEKAGLKGFRVGSIMISNMHANYFINLGKGKASDFLRLMDIVKERVFKLFSIELEPEIKFLRQ